jgi:hypothetical protein
MSDTPERIWADPPEIFDGMDIWRSDPGGKGVEYIRADLHRAEVEAAVKRALEAAAKQIDEGMSLFSCEGGSVRGEVVYNIRALASDPDALRRIVEGEE